MLILIKNVDVSLLERNYLIQQHNLIFLHSIFHFKEVTPLDWINHHFESKISDICDLKNELNFKSCNYRDIKDYLIDHDAV